MTLGGKRVFVGFGLGPIQTGLFLYEAQRSDEFGRLVAVEVARDLVQAIREGGGQLRVNVARADGVETVRVGPVEVFDPDDEKDRAHIVAAIRDADEIATAVPSVRFYRSKGPGSMHRLLARGLEKDVVRTRLIYAAENHNEAAEILSAAVQEELSSTTESGAPRGVFFLNTVIGKMSGVVADPVEIRERGLAPLVPGGGRAHLVEEFNRILISRPLGANGSVSRGLHVFEPKDDLIPFEEAKLYGHNAAHALAAYTGALHGLTYMHELRSRSRLLEEIRGAFLGESGEALVRKYAGTDALFTPNGYEAYADDLLRRMTNPYLGDRIDRVTRDPRRKLGWTDRLIGTMRLALSQGVQPRRFAAGAAAALAYLHGGRSPSVREAERVLREIWSEESVDPAAAEAVIDLVARALVGLEGKPTS